MTVKPLIWNGTEEVQGTKTIEPVLLILWDRRRYHFDDSSVHLQVGWMRTKVDAKV